MFFNLKFDYFSHDNKFVSDEVGEFLLFGGFGSLNVDTKDSVDEDAEETVAEQIVQSDLCVRKLLVIPTIS